MPQFAPCQSTLSPHIARGSPLITQFTVPPQVLHGSQSVTNYQKRTSMGSVVPPCLHRAREAVCCGLCPPKMDLHVCQRFRDSHGANTPGHTAQCNWRNVPFLKCTFQRQAALSEHQHPASGITTGGHQQSNMALDSLSLEQLVLPSGISTFTPPDLL